MTFGFYSLIFLQVIALSHGAGILEVKLVSYMNEGWRDIQGSCCGVDGSSDSRSCDSPCTPYFRICLKQWENPVHPEAPCYFGSRLTEVFTTDTVPNSQASVGVLKLDLAHANGYQDPMKFPFSFNWPGTMSLIVEVWHGSTNGSQHSAPSAPTDVQSSTGKQLLLRVAELRQLKVGYEWTMESHGNNYSRLELQYRVVCEQHYYGEDCTRYCRPRDDEYGHHVCTVNGTKHCMQGWMGPMCNRAICAEGCHPTNGFCTVPGECKCYLGYQGDLCDKCVRYPGCVHGTCTRSFECQCDEGWGGLFCNQDLNFCTHHKPCHNGATCTNTGSGHYTCQCAAGFTGVNCENRIETCAQSPCLNGGTCTESVANYTCHCPAGYSGRHCQTNARSCQDQPCENGATCVDTSNGYRCQCPPGYGGANCDIERDECAEKNPCVNGGTCISRRVSASAGSSLSSPVFYECSCPTGFTGARCETNINDCSLQPCLNGGTCQDLVGSFRCVCPAGFIGMLCQHNIDDCLKRPCANGGTCFDLVNDFRCMCRPGFRGKDCSIDINECESNPCRNGGTCTDSIDAYHCACPACFAGVNCEQRNDDCLANMDKWPRPDLFIQYNASGVPVPSLFNFGSASGHRDAANSNLSHSVLTVGVPMLVVFSLVMVALIIFVIFLYRKTKRQSNSCSTLTVDTASDLEACRKQNERNEWNERNERERRLIECQMCNNAVNPIRIAKTDNRCLEMENGSKTFSMVMTKDSPLHSPNSLSEFKSSSSDQENKNLNSSSSSSSASTRYKVTSVDKLDFSNSHERNNNNLLNSLTFSHHNKIMR